MQFEGLKVLQLLIINPAQEKFYKLKDTKQ